MSADLTQTAAAAAAALAVRRDPSATETLDECRRELAEPRPDGQLTALLAGWGYLALGEPTEAWECVRTAVSYGTDPQLTDRAALIAGLLAAQQLDAPALGGAWYRVSTDLRTVLDNTDFTADLTAQFTDSVIWPDHPDLRADLLPQLVATFDTRSRSLAALTLYAINHADGRPDLAVRAAGQVVELAHPAYVAAAWLGIAETLVKAGDEAAAVRACQEALAADGQYSARLLLGLAEGAEPDVHTQAGTLLGTLQRNAGDLDSAYLPEATRWFGRYIEGGYAAHPLAAAHLGELAYWVGDQQAALHWYQYTLDHTELPMLVEEAEQRMAELRA